MDAPKELYVREFDIAKLDKNGIFGANWHIKRALQSDTKYLRSDLAVDREKLVEWAKDTLGIKEHADNGDSWSIGYLCAMQDLIEKLKEL